MVFDLDSFKKSIYCEGDVSDTIVEAVVDGNKLDL